VNLGSFRILLSFFWTSWGVGVLNSAIFNSFHNRIEFGTILEGLRNFGGGGLNPPKPPSIRHWHYVRSRPLLHKSLHSFCHHPIFPCYIVWTTNSQVQSSSWDADCSSHAKEFLRIYRSQRFIIMFITAHLLSLSGASSHQSTLLHPVSWRSYLIWSSIYAYVLQAVSLLQVSPPTSACISALLIRATWPVLILLDLINYCLREQ